LARVNQSKRANYPPREAFSSCREYHNFLRNFDKF
jgi:hypothetical protein